MSSLEVVDLTQRPPEEDGDEPLAARAGWEDTLDEVEHDLSASGLETLQELIRRGTATSPSAAEASVLRALGWVGSGDALSMPDGEEARRRQQLAHDRIFYARIAKAQENAEQATQQKLMQAEMADVEECDKNWNRIPPPKRARVASAAGSSSSNAIDLSSSDEGGDVISLSGDSDEGAEPAPAEQKLRLRLVLPARRLQLFLPSGVELIYVLCAPRVQTALLALLDQVSSSLPRACPRLPPAPPPLDPSPSSPDPNSNHPVLPPHPSPARPPRSVSRAVSLPSPSPSGSSWCGTTPSTTPVLDTPPSTSRRCSRRAWARRSACRLATCT